MYGKFITGLIWYLQCYDTKVAFMSQSSWFLRRPKSFDKNYQSSSNFATKIVIPKHTFCKEVFLTKTLFFTWKWLIFMSKKWLLSKVPACKKSLRKHISRFRKYSLAWVLGTYFHSYCFLSCHLKWNGSCYEIIYWIDLGLFYVLFIFSTFLIFYF